MDCLVEWDYVAVSVMFLEPAVSGVSDDHEDPGSSIFSAKSFEPLQSFDVSVLNDILRIFMAFDQQARESVGGV